MDRDFLQVGWSTADYERLRHDMGDTEYFQYMYICGVSLRDIAVVQEALDSGVPVDAPVFGHGSTALLSAVHGNEELVRFLLERGAFVNVEDWEHVNPLHEAIRSGNVGMVRLLLAHGADPCYRNPRGSALEVAEGAGANDIAAVLREAGATPGPEQRQGRPESNLRVFRDLQAAYHRLIGAAKPRLL